MDSSVWIDFYNDVASPHVERLATAIRNETVIVGDLVLCEVLQGLGEEQTAAAVHADLAAFRLVEVAGFDIAVQAARNYRQLRAHGITVRKTVDVLIATRCIVEGWSLLHRDRDYEPFVTHLGLRPALRAI